jgi:hypothetical protein
VKQAVIEREIISMTASIRSLRSFFASTCKPSLRLSSVASLLLMIGVVCVPHAGAVPLTASFSGGFEVLGVPLTYPSGIAGTRAEMFISPCPL